jgi:hypothetical protein
MHRSLIVALACASCGSPSLFQPRSVNPDAVRKACAMEISCFAAPPIAHGGDCVSQIENGLATGFGILFGPSADDLERYVNCVNGASNCTDALNCASKNHGNAWCTAHPNSTCDGDTLVSCLDGWGIIQNDCTKFGMHCATANGASSCTDGNTCNPTVNASCNGNRVTSCDGITMLESSYDCGSQLPGSTCMTMTSGTSSTTGCFFPPGGGCGATSVTCDGTTGVICENGISLRVQCGQFASHCVVMTDPQDPTKQNFSCATNATDCDPSTATDSCNGNAIHMCVNGTYVDTPCSSLGLTTCQQGVGTAKCS